MDEGAHLSAEERSEYLVGVDAEGRLVDTRGKPLGTELTSIFCLDHNGGLYVAETCFLSAANGNANAHRTIHHPSLVGGGAVVAAGEMVLSGGILLAISNASGHYRPLPECLRVAVSSLHAKGARIHPNLRELHFGRTGSPLTVCGRPRHRLAPQGDEGGSEAVQARWDNRSLHPEGVDDSSSVSDRCC